MQLKLWIEKHSIIIQNILKISAQQRYLSKIKSNVWPSCQIWEAGGLLHFTGTIQISSCTILNINITPTFFSF